jgi:hypothetical protein
MKDDIMIVTFDDAAGCDDDMIILFLDNCTEYENASLGSRLVDWFHVLRTEYIKHNLKKAGRPVIQPVMPQMDLRQAHQPYPCGKY